MITPFQRRVYDETRKIPRGTVITYGELARRIGCGSARAVGQALRANPFAPEVPCHRVVAADGSLTGFYGQRDAATLAKKRRLLESEGIRFRSKPTSDLVSSEYLELHRDETEREMAVWYNGNAIVDERQMTKARLSLLGKTEI